MASVKKFDESAVVNQLRHIGVLFRILKIRIYVRKEQ